MILVVGATGELGSRVARLLAADGERVRALARGSSDPARVAQLQAAGVETVQGDLRDGASLAAACRGVEAVVSTATAIVRPDGTLSSVDTDGHLALVDAAEAAGMQRFVFVSFTMPQGFELEFPLWRSKRAVEERLRSSTLEYTVLWPNAFMESWLGPGTGFDYVNGSARYLAGGGGRIAFVTTADVARVAAAAVRHPGARDRVIPVGGPQAVTYREAVQLFEAASGRAFTVEEVPPEALRAGYAAEEDDKTRSFLALSLAMGHDWPAGPDEAARVLGLSSEGWTGVEEYAQAVTRSLRAGGAPA